MARCHGLALLAAAALGGGGLAALAVDNEPSCHTRAGAVVVDLDDRAHARVLDHARDAIRAGRARALQLERGGADENRAESLRGIPTKPGHDRDEYPPAVSREGGQGAHVRYVRSRENRSAGSVMGRQLRPFCDGQRFEFERE
jgi:Deoxyribonuclease NucA/NucB